MEKKFKEAVKATYVDILRTNEFVLEVIKVAVGAWKEAEAEFGPMPDIKEELDDLFEGTIKDPDEELLQEILSRRAA